MFLVLFVDLPVRDKHICIKHSSEEKTIYKILRMIWILIRIMIEIHGLVGLLKYSLNLTV